jgi:capsular polysaccharide transport system permease protein
VFPFLGNKRLRKATEDNKEVALGLARWRDTELQRSSSIEQLSPSRYGFNRVAEAAFQRGHRRNTVTRLGFVFIVVVPTAFAILYYSLLATPCYLSEAQFLVRGVSSSRISGMDAFFRVFGISRTVDDANVVNDYILSRDAVAALQKQLPLREIFSRPEGDALMRFPRLWEKDDFEALYRYYLQRVSLVDDTSKGITTLKVITFRAADSKLIATHLLALAEDMANRINTRAQSDTVLAAQKNVDDSETKVVAAQAALTGFRNKALLVDPSKVSDIDLLTMARLRADLTQTLAAVRENSITSPSTPELPVLLARADALKERIDAQRQDVRRGEALGVKVSNYEELNLARDIADKSLSAAVDSLEMAQQEARRQQIYVEEVSSPNLADESTEPRRLRGIATIFVLTFSVFSVVWILSVGASEHSQ